MPLDSIMYMHQLSSFWQYFEETWNFIFINYFDQCEWISALCEHIIVLFLKDVPPYPHNRSFSWLFVIFPYYCVSAGTILEKISRSTECCLCAGAFVCARVNMSSISFTPQCSLFEAISAAWYPTILRKSWVYSYLNETENKRTHS